MISLRSLQLTTGELLMDAIPDSEFWRFQKVMKDPNAPFVVDQRLYHHKIIHLRTKREPISDDFDLVRRGWETGSVKPSQLSDWDHTLFYGLTLPEWRIYTLDEKLLWPIFEIIDRDLIFPRCECEGCQTFFHNLHLRTYPVVMKMFRQPALPLAA
jgi:hypothetical protein